MQWVGRPETPPKLGLYPVPVDKHAQPAAQSGGPLQSPPPQLGHYDVSNQSGPFVPQHQRAHATARGHNYRAARFSSSAWQVFCSLQLTRAVIVACLFLRMIGGACANKGPSLLQAVTSAIGGAELGEGSSSKLEWGEDA